MVTQEMIHETEAALSDMDAAELLLLAEDAIEPGGKVGEIVHHPDMENPFGIKLAEVASAGWKVVYHTVTREPSLINGNLLGAQLNKLVPVPQADGTIRMQRAFTTQRPKEGPVRGTLKCILHEEHPQREYHKSLGLPTCGKSNMMSPLDVRSHAQHRHSREWATIEDDRQHGIAEEERLVRKALIAQYQSDQTSAAAAPPAPAPEPKQTIEAKVVAEVTKACPDCGEAVTAKVTGMNLKMMHHRRKAHPVAD